MSGLAYVGKQPSAPTDITNRLATNTALNSGPITSATVAAQIAGLVSGSTPGNTPGTAVYATKAYVDTVTAGFAPPSAITTATALLVPPSAAGAVYQSGGVNTALTGSYYGVATLNASGVVPASQIAASGTGYVLGPYGPTATTPGTTGGTPIKIVDWNIGTANIQFRLEAYFSAFVTSTMGHPVIEIYVTNSATAPANYSVAGTLIALGEGRNLYNDYFPVDCVPVPSSTGQTPSLYPTNYQVWVTAWLYDANNQSVSISNGQIANGSVFLIRGVA